MTEYSDNELVQQCLKGLTKAFEELVHRYQKPIFNAAYRMTRNKADAEDITQLTFIKVYEKLETFNSKYKFFSWIYRIAVNETLNALQIKGRFSSIGENGNGKVKTPEDIFEENELSEMIQDALVEMTVENHSVIVLKHLQHFSYRDMAFILDISEKKVKSRLFSARQQLKEILLRKGVLSHG